MPPAPPAPDPKAPFAIKVDNHLFLDGNNKFHSVAPTGSKVYNLGGGVLSLSSETRGGVLSGTLAVLPLKEEPSWMGKMRKIGIDEDVLQFFGAAASIASSIFTIIGWVQAAMKILELLGILKTKPSLEDMVRQILVKLDLVQDMVAETQSSGVKLEIDTARGFIEGNRDTCTERAKKVFEDAFRPVYDKDERRAIRREMVADVEEADGHYRTLLSPSRWMFLCQSKHYKGLWGFYTDPEEHELKNPPWWGSPRHVPRQRLADDGKSWVDVTYPAAYKARFDYRGALPHAIQCGMSLIAMIQSTEPEFRTTGFMRGALLDYAASIETLMVEMRRSLVRTKHTPEQFGYISPGNVMMLPMLGTPVTDPDAPPLLGTPVNPGLKRPLFYWQVGALDLCAHTDTYFNDLAARELPPYPAQPASHKLGMVDFDWVPPDYQLRWVEPQSSGTSGYWEIANAQECADAAERQSEAEFMLLLQASGYFQLAQLQSTFEHLATDPDETETVTGHSRPMRRQIGTREVEAKGYDGLLCDPVTATGTLKEFRCETTVQLTIQEPDRVNEVPTRILLVALGAPAGTASDAVLSEVELSPTPGVAAITLPAVWTFDFYVEKILAGEEMWLPNMKQLQYMRTRTLTVPTGKSLRSWVELGPDYYTAANELPSGSVRNKRFEALTLDCEFTRTDTDSRRVGWARVTSRPGTRNADHVYIATEETLSTRKKLRTYFEVELFTQLTFLPRIFFERERRCLAKTSGIVEEIERRFSESAPKLPPHVPVSVEIMRERVARATTVAPDLVRSMRGGQDPSSA